MPVWVGEADEVNLISSITSASIHKITFVYSMSWAPRRVEWENFDNTLYQLADRPGYNGKLEVDFRIVDDRGDGWQDVGLDIVESLAKFREKGRVRIILVGRDGSESVVCSSNGVI
jgi:hypothetical protein